MDAAKTYATVGFISIVALVAIFVGTRTTVMKGSVMAAKLLDGLKEQGEDRIDRIECDDEIPIGSTTTFVCTVFGGDESMDFAYEMDRDGALVATPLVQPRVQP